MPGTPPITDAHMHRGDLTIPESCLYVWSKSLFPISTPAAPPPMYVWILIEKQPCLMQDAHSTYRLFIAWKV